MKKFLKNRKAKGFTLVELLIVLIIIGILAGALLLVAGAGTDKANATKIVSNLRSAKAAALMAYADKNGDWAAVTPADVFKYMDKGVEVDKMTYDEGASEDYWVVYTASPDMTAGVADKLEQLRLNGVPIYQTQVDTSPDYSAGNVVYMRIN